MHNAYEQDVVCIVVRTHFSVMSLILDNGMCAWGGGQRPFFGNCVQGNELLITLNVLWSCKVFDEKLPNAACDDIEALYIQVHSTKKGRLLMELK